MQRGVVVIPKSIHKNRMEQNIDIWDFQLSEEDMAQIASWTLATAKLSTTATPALSRCCTA